MGEQQLGSFFGNVVAAWKGCTVHLGRQLLPFLQRLEAAMNDALLSPQHQQGHLQQTAGFAVGAVMFKVDAGGGTIVNAQAVRRAKQGKATQKIAQRTLF